MKIFCITGQKGGVSKTTTALAMAYRASRKFKVLMVDLDQQGNLTTYTEKGASLSSSDPTVFDVLKAEVPIKSAIINISTNIDLLPANVSLSKAERFFTDAEDMFLLSDALKYVEKDYDVAILDTGPGRGILITMAYVAADHVVIPCESDKGSVDSVVQVCKDVDSLRKGRLQLSHAKIAALLLNRFEASTNVSGAMLDWVRNFAEKHEDKPDVFTISKSVKVTECKYLKAFLQEYAPGCKATHDYDYATDVILERTMDYEKI